MRLCILRIGIHFLKYSGFRALVGLRDPFDDLLCWRDIYNKPIDCKARSSNGTEESIQKRQFFSMIVRIFLLVLVSDPGSVSPFFRDDVSTGPTFCLCGPRRKGVPWEEDCTMRKARRLTSSFKYTTWILAMQCSWTLMSIRMNHPFYVYGGQSFPARQEDSKLQILSR